jgi:hypothetical protein
MFALRARALEKNYLADFFPHNPSAATEPIMQFETKSSKWKQNGT